MSIIAKPPALSDSEVERYARQIVIPGVGALGQAKLCASRVHVVGDATAVEHTVSYLRAGGVRASTGLPTGDTDLLLVADADALPHRELEAAMSSSILLLWYRVLGTAIQSGTGPRTLAAALGSRATRSSGGSGPDSALAEALHAVAACDLAASAMQTLLDWPEQSFSAEVTLA